MYIIGERAKRARRYLVMFMETRDIIYIYVRLFLIRMRTLVFCELNSRARNGTNQYWFIINKRIQHFFVREASSPCNGNHFLVINIDYTTVSLTMFRYYV